MWYSSVHNYIINWTACLPWQFEQSYKVKVLIIDGEKKNSVKY